MKKKSYKEVETLRQRGKLRYLERQAEEQEAEQAIREYRPEPEEELPDNDIQNTIR